MPQIKLSKELALELLDDPISDEVIGKGRWSVRHRVVVKIGEKLYRADYSVGATEAQEECPWQSCVEVEFFEVEEYQKTVTDYRLMEETDATQEGN